MMMKTLLVPLDGSALAEQSLPYARILATNLQAKVCLLRVVTEAPYDDVLSESISAIYGMHDPLVLEQERQQYTYDMLRQNAQRYLEPHAGFLQAAGIEVALDVRFGPAADVIVEAALGQQVTMIVMATHGYSGFRRWALGSVTDKVIHATSTPTFIVRAEGLGCEPTLKRMMIPLDGSALAQQALPLATALAESSGAELLLMHAITATMEPYTGLSPRGRPIPQLAEVLAAQRDHALSYLDAQAEKLRAHGVSVTTQAIPGYAADVLVDEAARRGVDLIVMATHGYSGLKRWALGSVADKVLHASTTPLLLVRAQPER
jgi:nucleotide-binding universal stress UspA family protein